MLKDKEILTVFYEYLFQFGEVRVVYLVEKENFIDTSKLSLISERLFSGHSHYHLFTDFRILNNKQFLLIPTVNHFYWCVDLRNVLLMAEDAGRKNLLLIDFCKVHFGHIFREFLKVVRDVRINCFCSALFSPFKTLSLFS